MSAAIAQFEIRTRKVPGAPYTTHSIIVDGQVIRSQLGPYSVGEAESIVRAHLAPIPSRTDNMKEFMSAPKPGRPKKATVNATGFRWKEPEE